MMLLEDDMAVTDVADPFDMSLAAISKHLAILTKAGLISQEKRGRVKWCKLEPDAMRDAAIWMQSLVSMMHLTSMRLRPYLTPRIWVQAKRLRTSYFLPGF